MANKKKKSKQHAAEGKSSQKTDKKGKTNGENFSRQNKNFPKEERPGKRNHIATERKPNPGSTYANRGWRSNDAKPEDCFQSKASCLEPRAMSIVRLKELQSMTSTQVLHVLLDYREGFLNLISQSNLGQDKLHLIICALSAACGSNEKDRLTELFKFIQTVHQFMVTGLQSYLLDIEPPFAEIGLERFVVFLETFHELEPNKSFATLSIMISQLKEVCSPEGNLPKELLERVLLLEMKKCRYREKYSFSFLGRKDSNVSAPNDFRNIPLLPTSEDLNNKQPFLRQNIVIGQYDDVNHYLDIHFRLLREDYVRPLREGIQSYLEHLVNKGKNTRLQNVRVYKGLKFSQPAYTKDGVIYKVTFDVTPFKHTDWKINKRLLVGSLLCLSHNCFKTKVFGFVTERELESIKKGQFAMQIEDSDDLKLSEIPQMPFVALEPTAFFEAYRYNLKVLQQMNESNFPFAEFLVRLSRDVGPPSYLQGGPSEYCLQPLLGQAKRTTGKCCQKVRNENAGFKSMLFSLWAIERQSQNANTTPKCEILNDSTWPSAEDLELDHSQFKALKMALTKELAIIQGPPGTGKTHVGLKVMQALLHNSKQWEGNISDDTVGHILVVCYTNHALDQFLEGVLPYTRSIVRFGGACKNERLRFYTLKEIARNRLQRHDGEFMPLYWKIESLKSNLQQSKTKIFNEGELKTVINKYQYFSFYNDCPPYMPRHHPMMNYWLGEAIPGFKENMWGTFPPLDNTSELSSGLDAASGGMGDGHYGKTLDDKDPTNNEKTTAEKSDSPWCENSCDEEVKRKSIEIGNLDKFDAMPNDEIEMVKNVWELTTFDRWRLYKAWMERFVNHTHSRLKELNSDYQHVLEEKKWKENFEIAKQKKVIGMTTTGAAKFHKVIQNLKAQIVIVEEAAEVLEAHIVTALTRDTQHLILIGDHQQLRPNPTVYELAVRYKLDVSLFERLINNGLPFCRLEIQHRMKPCIAKLLVPHIYASLEDHNSVKEYEDIRGLSKSMFFIDHTVPEVVQFDSTSRINHFEAEYLVKLCSYLLKQGYEENQITILATYLGQCRLLSNLMSFRHEGIRVTVVDNFQGEENDIILLSLVRSNEDGIAGFLKIDNRVCVALSRARKGLYCIGNFSLLQKASPLWQKIGIDLVRMDAIGPNLSLSCQNHSTTTTVKVPTDFDGITNGGCSLPCDFRLECGHSCTRRCHPYDKDHLEFKCKKVCNEVVCPLGHKCPKSCHNPCDGCRQLKLLDFSPDVTSHHRSQKTSSNCKKRCHCSCNPCYVIVTKVFEPCGHKVEVQCCTDKCPANCDRTICNLNHNCPKKCYEPCDPCKVNVKKVIERCGHVINIPCCEDPNILVCLQPCKKTLDCGHNCQSKCDMPCGVCHVIVTKTIESCGHEIQLPCPRDQNVEMCLQQCLVVLDCGHNCPNKCHESCGPCRETVSKVIERCGHQIQLICHEDPNSQECLEPCEKVLSCGHNCPSLCHQPCGKCEVIVPKIIQGCDHEVNLPCYKDQNAEKCHAPCPKMLECGHNCQNQCFDPCGPCRVIVPKEFESCGHNAQLPCCTDPNNEDCCEPCPRDLTCGHRCTKTCGQPCNTKCCVLVTGKPSCGHSVQVECHLSQENEAVQAMCNQKCERDRSCGHPCPIPCGLPCQTECNKKVSQRSPCGHKVYIECCFRQSEPELLAACRQACGAKLQCGHVCSGTCYDCFEGRIHRVCEKKCCKPLICNHVCQDMCFLNCSPCSRGCENWCEHGRCCHMCGIPCIPCRKPCPWKCKHYRCTLTCGEPCDRPPCENPCTKILQCGHPCIGLCGEPCPRICRKCNYKEATAIFFGNEKDISSRFIKLEDCGHVFEVNGLGNWIASQTGSFMKLPSCPKCKTTIYYNRHFSAYIKICLFRKQQVKMRKIEESQHTRSKMCMIHQIFPRENLHILEISVNERRQLIRRLKDRKSPGIETILVNIVDAASGNTEMFFFDFLVLMENVLNFVNEISSIENRAKSENIKISDESIHYLCSCLDNVVSILNYSTGSGIFISVQLLQDIWWELRRLKLFCDFAANEKRLCESEEGSRAKVLFEEAAKILRRFGSFRESQEKNITDIIKELQEFYFITDVSNEQHKIVQSVNLLQNNWYHCQNGHVNAISGANDFNCSCHQ